MSLSTTACPQCGLAYTGGEIFCPNDGARLIASEVPASSPSQAPAVQKDPLLGQIVGGRYRILRKIGEGGMGIVYEAEHTVIEKRVGLKVLREDFSKRQDVVERFRQEAKSASKIGHEHIIDISDFGETSQGASFFVMELLHGHDLAEELSQKGALTPRRTIAIALQCARALGAAHAKGIVHRDMKPENIFLVRRDSTEDFIKIVDFGIAKMNDIETDGQPGRKLTKTGMIFGTPEYMSPEQAAGKKLDHRVDVYAMGVILYELLTGRVPFMGDTFMGILTQHMFESPPPITAINPNAQVPPELERIVWKALAKNPDERYRSMEELGADLEGALVRAPSSVASLAPPPGTVTHHGYQERTSQEDRVPRLIVSTPASQFLPRQKPKAGAALWISLGGLIVALGAGAAFVFARSNATYPLPPPTAAAVAPAPSPPIVPPAAPVPSEAQEVPKVVLVRVVTEPSGAIVNVEGRGEACQPTPCNFTTARDTPVRIEVTMSGYQASKTEILPTNDSNEVSVSLRKRESSRSRTRTTSNSSELKIPDAFAR